MHRDSPSNWPCNLPLAACRPGNQPGVASATVPPKPAASSATNTQPAQQASTAQRHVLEAGPDATPASSRQQQRSTLATGAQLPSAGVSGLRVEPESAHSRSPPWADQQSRAASCAIHGDSRGGGGDAAKASPTVQQASSCCLEATRRAAPDAAPLAHVAPADRCTGAAALGSTAGARQSAVNITAWRTKAEPGVAPQVASVSATAADWQGAGSGRRPPTPSRPHATAEATRPLLLQPPSSLRLPASRAPLQPATGNGVLVPGVLPSPPLAAGSRKQAGLLLKAARLGLLR